MGDSKPLRTKGRALQQGRKKQLATVNDTRPEKEETYVMNNLKHNKYHNHEGTQQQQWGTKQQQSTESDTRPDKEETSAGRPLQRPRRNEETQQPHKGEADTAATKQIQRRERNKKPGQCQPEEESLGGGEKTSRSSTTGTASSTASRTAGGDTPPP